MFLVRHFVTPIFKVLDVFVDTLWKHLNVLQGPFNVHPLGTPKLHV